MERIELIQKQRKKLGITWNELAEGLPIAGNSLRIAFGRKSVDEVYLDHVENKIQNAQNTPEVIQVDFTEMNVMMVPLVSKFAYAGYLDNLGDDEYVGELPTVAFANDVQNRGDYLAFEVKGDSMDNGLSNAILEGDILLARNVRQDYWSSKLHIRKWNFIIVHRDRGILIKRITKHDTNTNEITIHSLNDYYEDDTIHLKNVQAIYNVVDIKRKPIL
jgi:phage repressor protein C with HTH and peptisase S24 domain